MGLLNKDKAPLNIFASGEERGSWVITTIHLRKHQYVCEYHTYTIHDNEEALKQALREYNIGENTC